MIAARCFSYKIMRYFPYVLQLLRARPHVHNNKSWNHCLCDVKNGPVIVWDTQMMRHE